MKDLKGNEREIAQELMRLPVPGRERVIKAVSEATWPHRVVKLQTYQPELRYSVGCVGMSTFFFQQAVGQFHHELGRTLDWNDTNMSMAGCLGMPLSFTRKELRIYPRKDHAAFDRLVAASFLKDWKGQSYTPLRGGEFGFRPLPMPAHPFSKEHCSKMVEYVNSLKLPCWSFDEPKHYDSLDIMMVTLEQDLPHPAAGKWGEEHSKRSAEVSRVFEECKHQELICVMVGALDAPVHDEA